MYCTMHFMIKRSFLWKVNEPKNDNKWYRKTSLDLAQSTLSIA